MGTSAGSLTVAAFALAVAAATLWFNVVEPQRAKRRASLSVRWETHYRTRTHPQKVSGNAAVTRTHEVRSERLVITNHGPGTAEDIDVAVEPVPPLGPGGEPVRMKVELLPFPLAHVQQELHLPIGTSGAAAGGSLRVRLMWSDRRGRHETLFVVAEQALG